MASEQVMMAVIRAARPSFRGPVDKVVFAVHAAFSAAGYILHDTGPSAFAENALSSDAADEVGIDNWNASDGCYAFVYSNPDKDSKKVLMKCLAMKTNLVVDVLKDGDSEHIRILIDVDAYAKRNGGTTYASMYKNLNRLLQHVNKVILRKLDSSLAPTSLAQSSRFTFPPVPGYGDSDLFPGLGAGRYPMRGDFGGGSMLVGPHDPRFFGGRTGQLPGGLQGLPPGARFDPYGPPGVPAFEPNRFVRNLRRPSGGTHTDLQHFPGGSDYI